MLAALLVGERSPGLTGLSIGKWSDPLVPVYPSTSLETLGITDPPCGR
jgi:hypothetical protein